MYVSVFLPASERVWVRLQGKCGVIYVRTVRVRDPHHVHQWGSCVLNLLTAKFLDSASSVLASQLVQLSLVYSIRNWADVPPIQPGENASSHHRGADFGPGHKRICFLAGRVKFSSSSLLVKSSPPIFAIGLGRTIVHIEGTSARRPTTYRVA